MTKKILLSLMLVALFASCIREPEENDPQFIVEVGQLAPDFTMTMPNGETVRLYDLRGKVVMLQFTRNGCGVSEIEMMPRIETYIWQPLQNNTENFALFGIGRNNDAVQIADMKQRTGVTYPIGMDPGGNIFNLFAESTGGTTRNIIIDRDGYIRMLTRLFDINVFNQMVALINKLVAEED